MKKPQIDFTDSIGKNIIDIYHEYGQGIFFISFGDCFSCIGGYTSEGMGRIHDIKIQDIIHIPKEFAIKNGFCSLDEYELAEENYLNRIRQKRYEYEPRF